MIPSAGEIYDGYRFLGGDPNDENSWERFDNRPKTGDIIEGYRFKGGNPSAQESWEPFTRPSPEIAEAQRAATAGEEYWTGGAKRPKPTATQEVEPISFAIPEEQMVGARVERGLAEARQPSVTERLPAGAPVSERPLAMPAAPEMVETPEERRLRLLGLGAAAEQAIAAPVPAPTRPGPTVEAARQLEQQRTVEAARENLGEILAARAESENLFSKYKNYREVFAQKYPLTGAAMAGAAGLVSGTANIPNVIADAFNQTFINPVLNAAGLPQIPRVSTAFGTEFLAKAASDYMPEVGKQGMEEAYKKGEFGAWLASKVAANSPQIAQQLAAAFVPALRPLMLGTLSATAAGQSFAQGDDPRVAAAKGAVEYVTERIPLGVFDKVNDVLRGMSPAKQNVILAVAGQRALQAGGAITVNGLTNAIEETAAQFGGNVLDKYFQGKDIELTKDLGEAAVVGAVTGKVMSAPQVAGIATGRYEPTSILAQTLEGAEFVVPQIDQTTRAIQPQARVAGGVVPPAPAVPVRTMEQVREEVLSAQDVDTAISTSEQAVSEVPTRAQAAVEPQAAEPPVARAISQQGEIARRIALIEGMAPAVTPVTPQATEAPRIEAPPTGRAPVAIPEAPVEAPRIEVPPTGRVEVPAEAAPAEAPRVPAERIEAPATPAAPRIEVPPIGRVEAVAAPAASEKVSIPIGRSTRATVDAPRIWYHDPRGRGLNAEGGISGYPLPPKERELSQLFRDAKSTDGFVYLSPTPLSENSVAVDISQFPDRVRFTGQAEGYAIVRGDIPAASVSARQRTTEAAPEVSAPAAPTFTDFTAPKAKKAKGIAKGEILTFGSEKQAAAYVKSNKVRGFAPRQTEDGWVLSKPVRERTPAQIAAARQRMQVREDDDLLTALAKMGGINATNLERDGADGEDLKSVNKGSVLKPFRRTGGMSVDGAAEAMADMGYDVYDENGNIDADKARALIDEAIGGTKVYTPNGYIIVESRNIEERDRFEAAKEREAIEIINAMPAMAEDELLTAAAAPREIAPEVPVTAEIPAGAVRLEEPVPGEFIVATPVVQQENLDQAFAQAETQVRQGSTAQYENAEPTYEPTGPSDQPAARVSEPSPEYAVRRRGGLVQLRAGGFYQTLGEQGHLGLVGQRVDSPAKLAELAQIYRNPGYETFRVFFTDQDGRIVEQTGASARLPGQANFIGVTDGTQIFSDWIQSRMEKNNAEGFYILHNHPSGDPTPSQQDADATRAVATNGFLGHIVINGNRYAKIDANGEYELLPLQTFSTQDPVRRQLMQNGVIGTPIAADADVAKIGRLFTTSEDMSVVMAQGNTGVTAIGEIPNQTLLDPQRGPAAIRRFARFNGGAQIFVYTQPANRINPNVVRLYDQGFVTDVVSGNGNSIVAERGFSPNQGTFGGTRTRPIRQLGEERAVQEPSAEALPVREGARGGEAVGERDAQRQEAAREGRVGEAGAEEVAFRESDYRPSVVNWAKKEFGDRIAPNGNPVWQNFTRWFGDSQVVNEKGEPLVVYHGTTSDFSEFDKRKIGRELAAGAGFYFTTDPGQRGYAEGEGANVMPVYLSIQNPTSDSYLFRTNLTYDGMIFPLKSTPGVTHIAVREPNQIKSSVGNNGNFGTEPSIVAQPLPPYSAQLSRWFSELERQVSQGPESMPAAQWKGWIANRKTIKPDEIFWTGINDFLDLQTGKVSKQQIQDFLKENGVRVAEVELGGIDTADLDAYEQADNSWNIRRISDRSFVTNVQGFENDPEGAIQEAARRLGGEAPFQQYTIPGGENYRVVLLTLPINREEYAKSLIDPAVWDRMSQEQRDQFINAPIKGDGKRTYKSPHFTQPNVLAHIRVNDRVDADGKRVLFVEEIQSDWGQEGKKKGFARPSSKLDPDLLAWESPKGLTEDEYFDLVERLRSRYNVVDANEENSVYKKELATQRNGIPSAPFVTARQYVVYKDGKELVTKNKDGKDVRHRYDRAETAQAAAEKFDGEVRDMGLQASTEGWLNLALKKIMVMAAEGGYDRVAFINGEQSADRYDLSKRVDSIEVRWIKNAGRYNVAATSDGESVIERQVDDEAGIAEIIGKELANKAVSRIDKNGKYPERGTTLSGVDLKVGGEGMKTFYDQIVPNAVKKLLPKVGGGQMTQVSINAPDRREIGGGVVAQFDEERRIDQPGFDVTPKMREFVGGGMPLFQPLAPYEAGGNTVKYSINDPTNLELVQRTLQDRFAGLKRVEDVIQQTNGPLIDALVPSLQAELYSSRTAQRNLAFNNFELMPLEREIARRGLTQNEVEEYLHARHAPSRNKVMARRNPNAAEIKAKIASIEEAIKKAKRGSPEIQQLRFDLAAWKKVEPFKGTEEERLSLSGMSTQAAQEYLASLQGKKKADLEAVGKMVYSIVNKTKKTLIDGGVDGVDSFNDELEFYVPLYREGMEEQGGGFGQGFNIKGKTTRMATGSNRTVVDILAAIATARYIANNRVEKNRVANSMVGLAQTVGDNEIWSVELAEKEPVIDDRTGTVKMRPKRGTGAFTARIPDGKGGVIEHAIYFNQNNATAKQIEAAMKGIDVEQLNIVAQIFQPFTRWYANVNTQWNPIFGAVNFSRDLESSIIQTSDTPISGERTELIKRATLMIPSLFSEFKAQREGKTTDSETAKMLRDFQSRGGPTAGFRGTYNREEEAKRIVKHIRLLGDVGLKGMTYRQWQSFKSVTGYLIADYNNTLENAIRLSAYQLGLEKGMTKDRAALMAKDITVNFDRKGTATSSIGAFYAFFNPAVQQIERMGRLFEVSMTDKGIPKIGKRGQKIIGSLVMLGVAQAVALALSDIGEDEVKEFVKEKNFVLPLGFITKNLPSDEAEEFKSKPYLTFPMALGYNFFVGIGRIMGEYVFSGFKDAPKRMTQVLGLAVDSFNPLGSASLAQMVSPTALDPGVALVENKDWLGNNIYKENYDKFSQEPGWMRARDNASKMGVIVAMGTNWFFTGGPIGTGSIYVRPSFSESDIFSPTPDQIDYLVGQITGGIGRESIKLAKTIEAQFTGEELPAHARFLTARFYGEAKPLFVEGDKFYKNIKLMDEYKREIEGREEAGIDPGEYISKHPEAIMYTEARGRLREVQQLRKLKREKVAAGADKQEIRDIEHEITNLMADFNNRIDSYKE